MARKRSCECNECPKCKQTLYMREWTAKNRPSEAKRSREEKARRKALLIDLKVAAGCLHCGYNRCGEAMHFHHRDSGTKEFCVADGVMLAWERVLAEVAKCDVVCANCHYEQHYV